MMTMMMNYSMMGYSTTNWTGCLTTKNCCWSWTTVPIRLSKKTIHYWMTNCWGWTAKTKNWTRRSTGCWMTMNSAMSCCCWSWT